MTAQTIIDKARTQLGDTEGATGTQYLVADLLKYLNEGQRKIAELDLQSNAQRESVKMAEGSKQTLPSGSLGLIKVIRNMGTDGSTEGQIVRKIDRMIMDNMLPDWHETDAATPTTFYVYDPLLNRLNYDIYPPAPAPGTQAHYLEIVHGETPDDITASEEILDDRFDGALVDYVLYRAKSMHAEYAGQGGEAAFHYAAFQAAVTGKG